MSLKDISYLELWWLPCSAEQNNLCKFGRGNHEKHFCKIILNLDKLCCDVVKRHFSPSSSVDVVYKIFLSRALAAPLRNRAEPFV